MKHFPSPKPPRLMDIGPTVLDMFGVKVPPNMDGRPFTVADADGEVSEISSSDA
ncbi:unnamed protein product [marine sediment metagenome]|uniref:Uncharacterized protein n=1 Tax=marine sediment metagenome TaxID=412755 RepID=X1VX75_9ZZZZ